MATGYSDFSEYADDTRLLSTTEWVAHTGTGFDPIVLSETSPLSGGKLARVPTTDDQVVNCVIRNADVPTSVASEALVLTRRGTENVNSQHGVAVHCQTTYAAAGVFRNNDNATDNARIYRTDGTTWVEELLTTHGTDPISGKWCWVRFRIETDRTTRLRIWEYDTTEPETWDGLSAHPPSAFDTGISGLVLHHTNATFPTIDWAYFSWATAGDTAPLPAAGTAHARTIRSTTVGTLS